jgi:nucleolar protein 15
MAEWELTYPLQVVPSEEVHPQLWVGANKKFRKIPRARVEKMKHDKVSHASSSNCLIPSPLMSFAQPRTQQEQEHANKRVLEKQAGRRKKIKDAGIDYDFEGHVSAECYCGSCRWGSRLIRSQK